MVNAKNEVKGAHQTTKSQLYFLVSVTWLLLTSLYDSAVGKIRKTEYNRYVLKQKLYFVFLSFKLFKLLQFPEHLKELQQKLP